MSPYVFTGWRGGVDSTAIFIANQCITHQKALSDFLPICSRGRLHRRFSEFAGVGDTLKFGYRVGGRPYTFPTPRQFRSPYVDFKNHNFGYIALVACNSVQDRPLAFAGCVEPNRFYRAFGAFGVKSIGSDAVKVGFGGGVIEFHFRE